MSSEAKAVPATEKISKEELDNYFPKQATGKVKSSHSFKKLRTSQGISPEDLQLKPLHEIKHEIINDTSNMSQYEIDAVVDFLNTHKDAIKPPIMTQREIDLLLEFIIEQGIELGNHEFTDDEIDELNYRRFTE
ncbi:MAG: hypothetical protein K6G11_05545 [Lachnospiraceae bacterium]|nr:hypothetical protein [Lachnospiraceae bacterium]